MNIILGAIADYDYYLSYARFLILEYEFDMTSDN